MVGTTRTYRDVWEEVRRSQLFDLLLVDSSMLQFRLNRYPDPPMTYSYFECPFRVLTYREFLDREVGSSFSEVGDLFRSEYEEFVLSSAEPKESVTPIRYDFAPDRYCSVAHPASHLHIGCENEMRLGTTRILSPMSFTLLILRQRYPSYWIQLNSRGNTQTWSGAVRNSLDAVPQELLSTTTEHYLH